MFISSRYQHLEGKPVKLDDPNHEHSGKNRAGNGLLVTARFMLYFLIRSVYRTDQFPVHLFSLPLRSISDLFQIAFHIFKISSLKLEAWKYQIAISLRLQNYHALIRTSIVMACWIAMHIVKGPYSWQRRSW